MANAISLPYISSTLTSKEEAKLQMHQHWFVWIKVVLFYIISIGTIGVFLPIAIYFHLVVIKTEFGVTSSRCIKKTGIISIDTDEMRLSKIENVDMSQGIFGRVFGYGTVRITGTGGSTVTFTQVANPKGVKRYLDQIIEDK